VILYPVVSLVRKLMLALTVVFMQESTTFSLFAVNFQILAMIIMIGLTEPFAKKRDNAIDLFNEATLLWVNYTMTSFTDWMSDGDMRFNLGWSLIAVTIFNILINMLVLAVD